MSTAQTENSYNAETLSATETRLHASSPAFPSKSLLAQEAKVTINLAVDSSTLQPKKEATGITTDLSSESEVQESADTPTRSPVLDSETVALQGLYGEACVDDGSGTRISEAGVYGDEHIIK